MSATRFSFVVKTRSKDPDRSRTSRSVGCNAVEELKETTFRLKVVFIVKKQINKFMPFSISQPQSPDDIGIKYRNIIILYNNSVTPKIIFNN